MPPDMEPLDQIAELEGPYAKMAGALVQRVRLREEFRALVHVTPLKDWSHREGWFLLDCYWRDGEE